MPLIKFYVDKYSSSNLYDGELWQHMRGSGYVVKIIRRNCLQKPHGSFGFDTPKPFGPLKVAPQDLLHEQSAYR
jgi:hypothetical protein